MTRVSVIIDPMPALREAKKERVNAAFNDWTASTAHVDQAHAQKREWASARDPRCGECRWWRGRSWRRLHNRVLHAVS